MNRISLKCAHCGGSDFSVSVNYCIPRAIQLSCACGYITPIAFFSDSGRAYPINNSEERDLYERTFYEDVSDKDAFSCLRRSENL